MSRPTNQKPVYKLTSMQELTQIPVTNQYKAVSTFSGGGGSCLGYKLAGFNVLWANEFVEEAQKTYRANFPNTILNTNDIRTVSADDILQAIHMQAGEIDLFDGSPPCCAFSDSNRGRTKGNFKRENEWGKTRNYSDGKVQKQIENLFFA